MSKHIVVSGQPRSGTSLMMQTLGHLGVSLWGEKYPIEAHMLKHAATLPEDQRVAFLKDNEHKIKHAREMNPLGFYEVPSVVMNGFRRPKTDHDGKAVKIIVDGLYERKTPQGQKVGTPEHLISKIILCLRHPHQVSVSQEDLSGDVMVAGDDGEWHMAKQPLSPARYICSMGAFLDWLCDNDVLDERILTVDYDDFRINRENTVALICKHLGLSATDTQRAAAIGGVKPKLKRSTDFPGWAPDDQLAGELAVEMYDALRYWDRKRFPQLAARARELADHMRLENVRWVDTENGTWITVTPDVFRRGGLEPLVESLIPMSPKGCKYFEKGTDTYTVPRPLDLGDLTRPMVHCKRDDNAVTVEQCKHCWTWGSRRDGESIEGQRYRNGAG